MLNIYSKKVPKEYDSQNVIQIIDAEVKNTESKCNFCDGKIYWNPSVIHRRTRKKLPLSEPYFGHGTNPVAHRGCIYNLGNYFKQSAKALEQKINREARFYGALIRFEYLLFI